MSTDCKAKAEAKAKEKIEIEKPEKLSASPFRGLGGKGVIK